MMLTSSLLAEFRPVGVAGSSGGQVVAIDVFTSGRLRWLQANWEGRPVFGCIR